jgi:8-oxo-dGTP pyrophosphatase MutT (NUDIX family)
VTAPALREAARAIVLDPDDHVMLLRYDENGGFWATPGGSLEPGETSRQAVIRELREELGVGHVDLGPDQARNVYPNSQSGGYSRSQRPAREPARRGHGVAVHKAEIGSAVSFSPKGSCCSPA